MKALSGIYICEGKMLIQVKAPKPSEKRVFAGSLKHLLKSSVT
jgi:hypothetical protein